MFYNTNDVCAASIVSALRHKLCIKINWQRRNEGKRWNRNFIRVNIVETL